MDSDNFTTFQTFKGTIFDGEFVISIFLIINLTESC